MTRFGQVPGGELHVRQAYNARRQQRGLAMERLGDFELTREIGRGGMGVVYEARQISLGRRVALKVLPPGLGLSAQSIRRFEREARAAARLHHTNIVPVYVIGEHEGCHFYAMELVEGEPLSRVLDDLRERGSNPLLEATLTQTAGAPPTPPAATRERAGESSLTDSSAGSRQWFDGVAKMLAEVADALDYAHGQGIVHRDVKPSNLMLSREGKLCLTDFGLARMEQEPGMTVSGSFLGTPAYMSPEQIAAGRVKVDHRTDIYSLGAVLYELLALRRPFEGETREEVLSGILTKEPRPPRRVNPRVPLDLETICLKAMEKDPDRRYATAEELAADLRAYVQHGLITARRAGPLRRTTKWIRRHPVASTVTASVVLVALLAGVAWQYREGRRKEASARGVAEARLLEEQGDLRGALARTDAAVEVDPGNLEALSLRAWLHLSLYHSAEAEDDARAVLRRSPDDWRSHLVLAVSPFGGCGDQTIPFEEHIEAVEREAPDVEQGWLARAGLERSPEAALPKLDRVLEQNPRNARARFERWMVNMRLGRYEEARSDVEQLRVLRPALSYQAESAIQQVTGDLQGALASADKSLQIAPEEPWALSARGWILAAMGRRSEALEAVTRAETLDPLDCVIRYQRIRFLLDLSRYDEAAADARHLVDRHPNSAMANATLLLALSEPDRRNELAEAVDRYDARIPSWRNPIARRGARESIATAYLKLAQTTKALQRIEEIERSGDASSFTYCRKAQIVGLRSPPDCDGVRDALERAESFSHPDTTCLAWTYPVTIALRCPRLYDAKRALGFAEKALEDSPNDTNDLENLGLVLYRNARYPEALDALTRASAPGGDPTATLLGLALTRWRMGKQAEAREAYDRAIAKLDRTLDEPSVTDLRAEAAGLLGVDSP